MFVSPEDKSLGEASPLDLPSPLLYGPWLPKRRRGAVRLITPDEMAAWILLNDERLFILNKPGDVACHPSKAGPWSSLVGAAREYLQVPVVHLVFRLDRDTSGVVVLAKEREAARRLQTAVQERRYAKVYWAILTGELTSELVVDQPLADDPSGAVAVMTRPVPPGEGQPATSTFVPLAVGHGFTLARVTTATGRKHQIRAHALHAGYPLVGDKIYGPDPRLFLEFIETGWTPQLAEQLLLPRQALHCAEVDLRAAGEPHVFRAPLPDDMRTFCEEKMGLREVPAAGP